jgi:hypothetical protein
MRLSRLLTKVVAFTAVTFLVTAPSEATCRLRRLQRQQALAQLAQPSTGATSGIATSILLPFGLSLVRDVVQQQFAQPTPPATVVDFKCDLSDSGSLAESDRNKDTRERLKNINAKLGISQPPGDSNGNVPASTPVEISPPATIPSNRPTN